MSRRPGSWEPGRTALALVSLIVVLPRVSAAVDRPGAPLPRACQEPWIGVLASRRAIDLAANFGGLLASVPVKVGDHLQENDIIAVFDGRALAKDLNMALAGLAAARGDHRRAVSHQAEARRSLDRLHRLRARRDLGLVSAEEMEKAAAAYEQATAEASSARAKIAERQADCGKLTLAQSQATLRAPFAGVVAASYFAAGEQVPAGTRVVRIVASQPPIVRFAVPEGTKALTEGTAFRACVEGQGCTLSGHVTAVSPEIDPASRMLFVEGDIEQQQPATALGMVLTVVLADRSACPAP